MKKIFSAFLVFVCTALSVWGHPHMFIDNALSFDLSGGELRGFYIQWLFDEGFSSQIFLDFDAGMDYALSESEIRGIEQGAFSNLRRYDYFLELDRNGVQAEVPDAEEFHAWFDENGRLGYRFFIPLHLRQGNGETFRVAVYDPTFWCDIAYVDNAPLTLFPATADADIELYQDQALRIEYDNGNTVGGRNDAVYTGEAYPYVAEIRF